MSYTRKAAMSDADVKMSEWDPDFTKVTPDEATRISSAESSGFVSEEEIDWDNLAKYAG